MPSTPTTAQAPRLRKSPFIALQHRDFRLLWIGQLISVTGSQMQAVAINWHIWQLTQSALALGLIGLARLLPIIVFSLVGGVLADKRDRRRILLVTESCLMLVAIVLGGITDLGLVSPLAIYILSAVAAAAVSFDNPARQALVPNLVPREHLTNALTLFSILFQVTTIVGPGMAGILIAALGVGSIYWINAISFLAVLAALALMRTPSQEHLTSNGQQSNLQALREGLHFVVHQKIILSTMLLDFLATFFASATTLLPIFATAVLNVGSIGFGILSASEALGSVVAGAVVSLVGDIKSKGAVLLVSIGLYGLATILFGVSNLPLLSALFLALIGAGDTVSTDHASDHSTIGHSGQPARADDLGQHDLLHGGTPIGRDGSGCRGGTAWRPDVSRHRWGGNGHPRGTHGINRPRPAQLSRLE